MRRIVALFSLLLLPVGCSASGGDDSQGSGAGVYPDPPDGSVVTWNSWVSGFSNEYCVSCHNPGASCGGSGCHTADNPSLESLLFDMREQSAWVARESTIQCGIVASTQDQDPSWNCTVTPETYPKPSPGYPLPTDSARAIVAAWIDAGSP